MPADLETFGKSATALFTLRGHRGEGMALLAMNWKKVDPPPDKDGGAVDPRTKSSRLSPIQMFRWVHFPRNVTFTRGFVSSQAFVDKYEADGPISTLLPAKASAGPTFKPTHPEAERALEWMGFEARRTSSIA